MRRVSGWGRTAAGYKHAVHLGRASFRAGRAARLNRRIFAGVVVMWILLEGTRSIWKTWAGQNEGRNGIKGTLARDVREVTS